ncbi:sodium/hydrogen exchanger 3 [Ixodes scapularis]|uniref:sodium/hydrogen exchanger 3 n=1 Tax=Ixodes scapularis TaxID=6945 RepID=UPI001A9D53A4|nr:sodium/hydrogen exchanger 3 [Ixodes scapularis]
MSISMTLSVTSGFKESRKKKVSNLESEKQKRFGASMAIHVLPYSPVTMYRTYYFKLMQTSYVFFMRKDKALAQPSNPPLVIRRSSTLPAGFHVTPKLHLICPESCILIVIGVVIGLLLFYTGLTSVGPLTPDVFFLFMLPPIVLDAGYYMPNRSFFDNLGSILTYAVLGTVWNTLTIGLCLWGVGLSGLYGTDVPLLDALLFSSIISAVDPVAVLAVFEEIHVNDVLYILVFGESLLNDAVTVVLYRMFEAYTNMGQENIIPADYVSGVASFFVVALGGTGVGILWGLVAAFVSRFTHHVRAIEPLFVFILGYLSYLSAELFHLSGILALTFCGLTMKNYVEENISQKSHTTLKYGMKMLANCSETIIFMFLGVSTVNDIHEWNTWFVILTIVFITVFRSVGVVLLTWPINRFRVHTLNKVDQFIMAYGGLRGAVAFALVLVVNEDVIPTKKMLVTTTIAVIYFTVFVQGMTIGPLVRLLNVPQSVKGQMSMNERLHTRLMDHLMAGLEDVTGQFMGNYKIRDKFKYYNNRFLRPMLLKDHSIREPKIIETYSKLNLADAMSLMKNNNSLVPVMTNENGLSLASLFRTYTQTNLSKSNTAAEPTLGELDLPLDRTATVLNFDMNELQYSPSNKDYADAQLHHILSDSMFKPSRRVKRLSRDRIDGAEDQPAFHHHMRMQIRTFLGEERRRMRKARSSRSPHQQQHHHSGHGEDPPVPCRHQQEASRKVPNGDKPQLRFSLPMNGDCPVNIDSQPSKTPGLGSHHDPGTHLTQQGDADEGIVFVARPAGSSPPSGSPRAYSPPPPQLESLTETETTLPWKRDDVPDAAGVRARCGSGDGGVRQREFPSWIDNRDYISYQSPTSTILGRLDRHKRATPDIFELFQLKPGTNPIATMEEVREEDHRDGDSLSPESPLAQLPAGPQDDSHEGGPSSTTSTEPLPPASTWEETVIDVDSDDSDSSSRQVRL